MNRFLKLITVVVSVALVGEATSLVVFKAPTIAELAFNSYTGWLPRPSAAGWNAESFEFVKKSNLGWHDNNIKLNTKVQCTINFFGDSMLEGFQYDSQSTFSSILENNLSKTDKCHSFYVNNFGLSGTGTLQQARIMKIYGNKYSASRTGVFLFLGNDLSNNIYFSGTPYRPGFKMLGEEIMITEADYHVSYKKAKDFLARSADHSNLIRLILATYQSINTPQHSNDVEVSDFNSYTEMGIRPINEDIETQLLALEKSLEMLYLEAQEQETDLTIFMIPTGEEVAKGDNKLMDKIKKRIMYNCKGIRLNCIDLLPNMIKQNVGRNESSHHIDGVAHLSRSGNLAVASILLNFYKN